MKRYVIPFVLFTSISLILFIFMDKEEDTVELTILHHNDFHAWNSDWELKHNGEMITIHGAAGLKGLADAVRDSAKQNIWLFAGDEYTGTPISTISQGASQIQILSQLGVNVAVLGNHEFDYSIARAEAFRDSLGFPVLGGANLRYSNGKPFALTHFDTTIAKTKIRIIGVVPPNLKNLTRPSVSNDLVLIDHIAAVKKLMPPNNWLSIALTHSDFYFDSLLAVNLPDLDVIVSGHEHKVMASPFLLNRDTLISDESYFDSDEAINGTLIVQAGSRGVYLGVLSLAVKGGSVIRAKGQLLRNDSRVATIDTTLSEFVKNLEAPYEEKLDEVIAKVGEFMGSRSDVGSPLGEWTAEAFRRYVNADIGIHNAGGVRKSLNVGDLRLRDAYEVNPFNNTLVTFYLRGNELINLLKSSNFSNGTLIQSGMNAKNATTMSGEVIAPFKDYIAVTNSFIFDHFERLLLLPLEGRKVEQLNVIDVEAFVSYAKQTAVLKPLTRSDD